MAFTRKIISATFLLGGSQTFSGTQSNTLTVKGLRCSLRTQEVANVRATLDFKIYGLTPSQMNNLSTYGAPTPQQLNNEITIAAGDDENGLAIVFQGTISTCEPDYNELPEVGVYIQAHTYQYIAVAPADALSYSGSASVATIMSNIAMRMGLSLENNGVNVSLSNPTFGGSLVAQMRACARAANIYAQIDQVRSVLAIWPKNGSRSGAPVMVSPDNGLVGYPRFGLRQIQFKTLFNPSLVTGRRVQVQSSLQPACGIFTVIGLDIDLAAEEPNGPWFSTVTAAVIG